MVHTEYSTFSLFILIFLQLGLYLLVVYLPIYCLLFKEDSQSGFSILKDMGRRYQSFGTETEENKLFHNYGNQPMGLFFI